jgi:dolichyl-phosphate beta-glucosyltransferase
MLMAKGRYRFFTDADLPYHLDCLVEAMSVFQEKKCDMVIGARDLAASSDHAGTGLARRWAGKAFSMFTNKLMKMDVGDSQCGFKGFRDQAAFEIFSRGTVHGYAFDVELLLLSRRMGFRVEKIPVTLVQKHYSKIRLIRDALKMTRDVMRLYQKQRREQ